MLSPFRSISTDAPASRPVSNAVTTRRQNSNTNSSHATSRTLSGMPPFQAELQDHHSEPPPPYLESEQAHNWEQHTNSHFDPHVPVHTDNPSPQGVRRASHVINVDEQLFLMNTSGPRQTQMTNEPVSTAVLCIKLVWLCLPVPVAELEYWQHNKILHISLT